MGRWPDAADFRRRAELGEDGAKAGERRARGEHQDRESTFVLELRPQADVPDVRQRHEMVREGEIERDADVPADQQPSREPPHARQRRDDDDSDHGGNEQAWSCADDAHG